MTITKVHFDFGDHLQRLAGHTIPLFCVDVPKQTEESLAGGGICMDRKYRDRETYQGRWANTWQGHCLPNCEGLSGVASLFGVSMTYAPETNTHLWHFFASLIISSIGKNVPLPSRYSERESNNQGEISSGKNRTNSDRINEWILASENEGCGRNGVIFRRGLRRIDAINGAWSEFAQHFSTLTVIALQESVSPPRANIMSAYVMHRFLNVMRTLSRRQKADCMIFAMIASGSKWSLTLGNDQYNGEPAENAITQ